MCLLAKMSWIKECGNNAEMWRLSTFLNWPKVANVSPLALARCGFFYIGEGDKVKCFKCNSAHENWQDGENPEVRHRQESPRCSLAQGDTDGNVPLKVPNEIIQEDSKPITSDIDSQYTHCAKNSEINSLPSEGEVSDCGINSVYQSALERAIRHGVFSQGLTPLDRNDPDFDGLRTESVRLSTYHDWPPRAHAQPRDLVKEGFFFTGIDDQVQCAFCRGFLRNWVPGDIPTEEHRKHFPECPFIRGVDVGNIPLNSATRSEVREPILSSSPVEILLEETLQAPDPVTLQRPRHPEYSAEVRRIHSFRGGYVPRGQSIETLAKAGFYYVGPHDNVRCFHCDGGLKNWQADDDPWVEHGRWFPRCAYLATQRDQMFIEAAQVPRNPTLAENLPSNSVGVPLNKNTKQGGKINSEPEDGKATANMNSTLVRAILDMGYSEDLIHRAIQRRLETTGSDFPNAESLIEAIFQIEELENSATERKQPEVESTEAGTTSAATISSMSTTITTLPVSVSPTTIPPPISISMASSTPNPKVSNKRSRGRKKKNQSPVADERNLTSLSDQPQAVEPDDLKQDEDVAGDPLDDLETQSLLEENRILKDARTCKVCMDAEVNTVFLPCGHLVCCNNCSPELRNCAICRALIRGTVRIFLS